MALSTRHNSITHMRKSTRRSSLRVSLRLSRTPSMISKHLSSRRLQLRLLPQCHSRRHWSTLPISITGTKGTWAQVSLTCIRVFPMCNLTRVFFLQAIWSTSPCSIFLDTASAPLNRKAAPKKLKLTKMDTIQLRGISRVNFIEAFLKIHALSDNYSPGVHSGPSFKVWWTGSGGGKGGAPSILNDHQFGVALAALLAKDPSRVQVSVEIDLADMEGFRIKSVVNVSTSQIFRG